MDSISPHLITKRAQEIGSIAREEARKQLNKEFGRGKWTFEQFAERSNEIIDELLAKPEPQPNKVVQFAKDIFKAIKP